jgi:tetratricopeptide (TPR) repeat protein
VQQKPKQRSELIWLYYLNSEYTKALSLIYMVEKETGLTTRLNQLKVKLELKNKPIALKVSKDSLTQLITDYEANKPSFSKLKKILTLAINENTEVFYKYSSLAIDLYPAQPFAYLSRGKALQLQKKHQQAIDVLEIGIDFVIENSLLEAQFYTTLVKAYTSINNPKKVLEYKIKLKNHKI